METYLQFKLFGLHVLQNFFTLAVLFTFENKRIVLHCVICIQSAF